MTDAEKIDSYIKKHEQWSDVFTQFRAILQATELTETVKWGAPSYTLQDKIVVTFTGFKNHCALWFQQGVFLKDEGGNLVNAQEGITRAQRQWRFEVGDKVDKSQVKAYVLEAIENHKAGKQIKPAKKELLIPVELTQAFNENERLKKGFDSLPPFKRREFADHIGSAKQEKTRLSRLAKATPKIIAGIGLNDKFRSG